MITSFIKWLIIGSLTIILAIIAILISFFSPMLATLTVVKFWGKSILFISGVKLKVDGIENIENKPTIVMYNHKSFFDIFAFASFMKFDWRAMMKKELLKIPFFGQAVQVMGHYFVARDGSFSDRREVVKILKRIKSGKTIFIAPEGTRNTNPGLLEFKDGGFFIASKTQVNIVPMIIKGADSIVKKNSFKINKGEIKIKILKEIDITSYDKDKKGISELKKDIKKIFESEISS
tara:strand:- start:1391 stop:2092 length:702 start_codon:yes stop_codon:yes gene_type:complete